MEAFPYYYNSHIMPNTVTARGEPYRRFILMNVQISPACESFQYHTCMRDIRMLENKHVYAGTQKSKKLTCNQQ